MYEKYLILIAGAIIAYLIGSVSSSVWIGKIFYKLDVREEGSGNAGATNTFRVLGVKAGIAVMIIDVMKAWCAVQLAPIFAVDFLSAQALINYKIILGVFAVIGHVFPVYTSFRGGKGVASLVGVMLALLPYSFFLVLGWFLLVFLTTRYVSLASVTSALLFPVMVVFIFHEQSFSLILLSLVIAVFVPLTHHKNIRRLLKGQESKMKFRTSREIKNK